MTGQPPIMVSYVIFDRPRDFPDHYVVRRQFVKARADDVIDRELAPLGTIATDDPHVESDAGDAGVILADSLADARALVPEGMICIDRDPEDVLSMVEVWI